MPSEFIQQILIYKKNYTINRTCYRTISPKIIFYKICGDYAIFCLVARDVGGDNKTKPWEEEQN